MPSRRVIPTTPRLLVVGLFVFGWACSRKAVPAPTPTPTPAKPPAAARPRATPAADRITSASLLLEAMHARYAGKWFTTITFTQTTKITLSGGSDLTQTWQQSAALPGRLRIDTDGASRSGVLYARDSVFTFTNGTLVRADAGHNELLLLGFDVYAQSVARSRMILEAKGFDFSKFHETTWQGKPVYVVGAAAGDTTSRQFWVDRERLVVVRMIQRSPQGRQDTRFESYEPAGGGWLAKEVVQYMNGKVRLRETRSNPRIDVTLAPALFDPRQWTTAK